MKYEKSVAVTVLSLIFILMFPIRTFASEEKVSQDILLDKANESYSSIEIYDSLEEFYQDESNNNSVAAIPSTMQLSKKASPDYVTAALIRSGNTQTVIIKYSNLQKVKLIKHISLMARKEYQNTSVTL